MVFVLALLLLLASSLEGLQAQVVDEVLQRVQNFYNELQSLRGEFTQETFFPQGQRETRTGKFWIKKPGLFRWEYHTPEKFIIIFDSRNFYVYYPEEDQAFVYPSGKVFFSQLALGFMTGKGDIRKDLKLESFKVNENNIWELNFLPAYQDPQIEKITMKIHSQKGEVKEIIFYYFSGEWVKIFLKNLKYNVNITNKLFEIHSFKKTKFN